MRAVTVIPGQQGSVALTNMPEPPDQDGPILVQTQAIGANRHHYELAAKALAQADPGWLADLITRQVPLDQWADAYTRRPDDIKTILSFADESP